MRLKKKITNKLLFRKRMLRPLVAITLPMLIMIAGSASDGKALSIPPQAERNINGYQWFMIAVGVGYGVYLVVRWKNQIRNGKSEEESS